jgi:enamine deaminase RidA (YjgF/YER057c/UK114 family)
MEGISSVLKEAGMTMKDLVSVQVFTPDVSSWESFNKVYRTYFTGDLPARAFIGSGKLLFGARFEMQGIAVKRRVAHSRKVAG